MTSASALRRRLKKGDEGDEDDEDDKTELVYDETENDEDDEDDRPCRLVGRAHNAWHRMRRARHA